MIKEKSNSVENDAQSWLYPLILYSFPGRAILVISLLGYTLLQNTPLVWLVCLFLIPVLVPALETGFRIIFREQFPASQLSKASFFGMFFVLTTGAASLFVSNGSGKEQLQPFPLIPFLLAFLAGIYIQLFWKLSSDDGQQ